MRKKIKILFIDDSEDDVMLLIREIKKEGFDIFYKRVDTYRGMNNALKENDWDLVISDYMMPQFNGLDALELFKKKSLDIPFIIVSGKIGEEIAVQAMRNGASDYIMKDNLSRLTETIKRQIKDSNIRTEHKKIQKELEELNNFNRYVINVLPFGMDITASNGDLIYVNEKLQLKKPQKKELKKCWQVYYESNNRCDFCPFDLNIKIGETRSIVHRYKNRLFIVTYTGIKYKNRKSILKIFNDITSQRKAEIALKESESKYKKLIDNATNGIIIVQDNHIKFANPQAAKLSGFSEKEMASRHFIEFIYHDDREKILFWYKELVKEKKRNNVIQIRIINKKGDLRLLRCNFVSIKWERRPAILILFDDITEINRLQEQFAQTEKFAAVGQLSAGIAHEFNNILSIIRLNVQLINHDINNNDENKGFLKIIEDQTKKAEKIVRDMNTFAKPKLAHLQECKISDIINQSIDMVKKQFKLLNIDIKIRYKKHSSVKIDPGQIQEVFVNLFINARDALVSRDKGLIKISVEEDDKNIIIVFEDNGTGIEDGIIKNIFDPFYTTKGAMSKNNLGIEGTGLGLSITRSIIKNHSGTIGVESVIGKYTKFIITLPISGEGSGKEKKPEQVSAKLLPGAEKLKYLIVDDEESLSISLDLILKRNGIVDVTTVNSGNRALTEYKKKDFNIVFLDLLMPGIKGENVAEKMVESNPGITIVFISGKSEQNIGEIFLGDNIFYIQKPFNINDVVNVINKINKK